MLMRPQRLMRNTCKHQCPSSHYIVRLKPKQRLQSRGAGQVISKEKQVPLQQYKDNRFTSDLFRSFPHAQAYGAPYSFTRYDAPKTNRLLR